MSNPTISEAVILRFSCKASQNIVLYLTLRNYEFIKFISFSFNGYSIRLTSKSGNPISIDTLYQIHKECIIDKELINIKLILTYLSDIMFSIQKYKDFTKTNNSSINMTFYNFIFSELDKIKWFIEQKIKDVYTDNDKIELIESLWFKCIWSLHLIYKKWDSKFKHFLIK
jgi:hypothetical protein